MTQEFQHWDRRAIEYAVQSAMSRAQMTANIRIGGPRNRVQRRGDPESLTCPECTEMVDATHGVYPDCACIRGAVEQAREETFDAYREQGVQGHLANADIPPRFSDSSFSNFEARPGTAEALDACMTYAAEFGVKRTEHGLFLLGVPGNGKTHLAIATMRRAIERTLVYAAFTTAADLVARCWQGSWDNGPLLAAAKAEILVFDDLGKEHVNDFIRSKLFELIDSRYKAARPMIVTTNQSEKEIIDRLGEAAISRIREMCDPYVVTATDFRPIMAQRRRRAS